MSEPRKPRINENHSKAVAPFLADERYQLVRDAMRELEVLKRQKRVEIIEPLTSKEITRLAEKHQSEWRKVEQLEAVTAAHRPSCGCTLCRQCRAASEGSK